jgi:hypothetical protein
MVTKQELMMKVPYISPIFRNIDGTPRTFMVPADALATYAKRDDALLKMTNLGGIHADPTPEFMAIRSKMMSAKRKIQRMGWFSQLA